MTTASRGCSNSGCSNSGCSNVKKRKRESDKKEEWPQIVVRRSTLESVLKEFDSKRTGVLVEWKADSISFTGQTNRGVVRILIGVEEFRSRRSSHTDDAECYIRVERWRIDGQ